MQTPTSEIQSLLQGSLDSKNPEELAPLAELLAQQAREARLAHPAASVFLGLEIRFLELAANYARSLKNAGREAALIETLAALVPDHQRATAYLLRAAACYATAGRPEDADRIYRQVTDADSDLGAKLTAGIGSAAIRIDHEQNPEQSLAIVEGLIDQARTAGLKALHLRLALVRTRFFIQMGRPDAAADSIRIADELGDECPDSEYRLLVKAVAAHVWSRQGKFREALRAVDGVLKAGADDTHWTEIQEHAGCVFANCGLHSKAREIFETTMHRYHEAGDRFGKARLELYLARLLIDEGRWREARVPLSLAASEFKALGREHWLGFTAPANVEILMGKGDWDGAERELRTARNLLSVKTSRLHTYAVHEMAGDLHRHAGRHADALREYNQSREVARDAGLMREAARGALNCAHVHFALGRLATAETQAVLSISLLGEDWRFRLVEYVEAKAALARIHLKRGHFIDARQATLDALEAADELNLLDQENAPRAEVLINDLRRLEDLVGPAGGSEVTD
ncbi:MAG: hypothetical protein K8I27_07335 [Planctomycetes bacterium]|nr:hypothetical protein [Planctomycetota bacterium]